MKQKQQSDNRWQCPLSMGEQISEIFKDQEIFKQRAISCKQIMQANMTRLDNFKTFRKDNKNNVFITGYKISMITMTNVTS